MVYLLVASFSFFFSLPYWKCFLFSTTNTTNRGTTNRVFFIFSVCLSFLLIGSQLNPTLLVFYFILFYFILFYLVFFFPCKHSASTWVFFFVFSPCKHSASTWVFFLSILFRDLICARLSCSSDHNNNLYTPTCLYDWLVVNLKKGCVRWTSKEVIKLC